MGCNHDVVGQVRLALFSVGVRHHGIDTLEVYFAFVALAFC